MVVLVQICWILGTQESLYISEFLTGSPNDIRNSGPWAFLPIIMRLCLLWTRHAWLLRTASSSSDWLLKNPITTFLTKACLFTQAIHNTHVWISTVNSTDFSDFSHFILITSQQPCHGVVASPPMAAHTDVDGSSGCPRMCMEGQSHRFYSHDIEVGYSLEVWFAEVTNE